jgi:hypothetical protein
MYLAISRKPRSRDRGRSSRHRAKLKAKNRRRVNRMAGRALGQR